MSLSRLRCRTHDVRKMPAYGILLRLTTLQPPHRGYEPLVSPALGGRVSTEESVGRIMVETVFTVSGEAIVADAAALMVEKRISCLPVSLGQGAVGMITEKDIISKVVAVGKDPRKIRAKDIMSTPLILSPLDSTIKEAAERMLQHHVRRLVVTDKDGKLSGLVTMTDIIRWIAQNQGNSSYLLRYVASKLDSHDSNV